MSISDLLRLTAREQPAAEAIVDRSRRITYAEFDRSVDSIASGLLRAGVLPGDRAALWLPNHAEYLLIYLACLRVGIVVVPINIRLADDEVQYVLEHSGASILFSIGQFQGQDFLARSRALKRRVAGLGRVIAVDSNADAHDDQTLVYRELLAASDTARVRELEERVAESELALIIYTSGTTGRPKGAMITHGALRFYGIKAAEVGLFRKNDRILLMVPFATAAGSIIQTIPALQVGATLVLMETFKAAASLEMIQSEHITCLAGPPTIYILQMNVPDFDRYDLSTLQRVLVGAAPVASELAAELCRRMPARVINAYGATETAGLVTWMPPGVSIEQTTGTSGQPIPGFQIKIVDATRREVAAGTTGEIAVRGGSITKGYYRDEEQSAKVLDADGWWYSGDLGSMDSSGFLTIGGRQKEMYIRGGFNVYPAEVEAVLQKHPAILMAAVIGVPDPVLGEKGRAFVVLREGNLLSPEQVREFCRAKISDYKLPDEVVFRDSLPMSGLGKVQKSRLAEEP
ncbi:MAG TPA: AMP-binding protein [Candidatus Binataceae bacterium]|nr:AMP-binding protein [Candidatus Binataceae bacterium]